MRRDFTPLALALLILCCASWGFQQVAVKLILPEVPAAFQAALRSWIGLAVVLAYALIAGRDLSLRDGTLGPGLLAGAMFAVEFAALFAALGLTDAARVVMLLFSAPFVVAIGGRFLPQPEPLALDRLAGIAIAFVGLAVLLEPWKGAARATLAGDLLALSAGILWGLTTLLVKATALRTAEPAKVLLLQLAASAVLLLPISLAMGESWRLPASSGAWLSLAYTGVWVVAFTYLVWFWMLRTYPAAKLSALTFLTPVFGILFGWLVLDEALTANFALAAVLVIGGIVLVTRPARA
jgi:drug/metabolite transporter (DMT)-like permease